MCVWYVRLYVRGGWDERGTLVLAIMNGCTISGCRGEARGGENKEVMVRFGRSHGAAEPPHALCRRWVSRSSIPPERTLRASRFLRMMFSRSSIPPERTLRASRFLRMMFSRSSIPPERTLRASVESNRTEPAARRLPPFARSVAVKRADWSSRIAHQLSRVSSLPLFDLSRWKN